MFRPDDVGKIFGQDHLQEVLISWVENKDVIPQSILLSGPYGTGKTTIARILANCIISTNKDLNEINAANARGIDDVRAWNESSRFSPFGNGKVFVIDELHQMTNAAQSAMLKIIEEPPKQVYFILCTTEPSRLLPAIRSRCTHLELKLLKEIDTIALLRYAFNNKLSIDIMKTIHMKSDGHARDAIKMAEIAVLTNAITVEELNNQVGLAAYEIQTLLESIFEFQCTWNTAKQLLDVQEENMLGEILDNTIDTKASSAYIWVLENYHELLNIRILRKEYKISVRQQILHFLSLAKKYCLL